MIPIVYIPLSSGLRKRGGCLYGVIYSNRKFSKTLVKNLLYKSVFYGIKVYELYVLDLYISQKWKTLSSLEKFSFVALLSLTCERRRPSLDWESNIRKTLPLVKNYIQRDELGKGTKLVDFLVKNQLIVKDASLILDFRKTYRFHKAPLPISSIGVGYKDKGSSNLPKGYDSSADTRLLSRFPVADNPVPFDESLSPQDVLAEWKVLLHLEPVDGPDN
jgi:hypothetical protein